MDLSFHLSYPARSALEQPIDQLKISLTDFYHLQNCPAIQLIAQRNTTLGKLQTPSQRYLYETELILALQQCAQHAKPTQQHTIKRWLEIKRQQLPAVWANLLQLSEESKQFLSANRPLTDNDNQSQSNAAKQAFEYLIALRNTPKTDSQQLEKNLFTLQQNTLLAKVWYSQGVLSAGLRQLNHWLDDQLNTAPCKQPEMNYLNNVFQLFFIQKIQASANQINQLQYQFMPLAQAITKSPVLTSEFKQLFTQQQQNHNQLKQHIQQHVQLWKHYLSRCNLAHFANK